MAKLIHRVKKHFLGMSSEVLKQMLTLSTSGFGLVAALAWNELIKEVVTIYIKPLAGESSGILTLFIYAVIITMLAVIVTYNLTKLTNKR